MVMVRCLPSMLEALSSVLSVLDQFQGQEKRPPLQKKHLDRVALDQKGMLRGVTQKQGTDCTWILCESGWCLSFLQWLGSDLAVLFDWLI